MQELFHILYQYSIRNCPENISRQKSWLSWTTVGGCRYIVYPPAQSSHDTFITGSHLRHLTTSRLQMPSPAATAQLASPLNLGFTSCCCWIFKNICQQNGGEWFSLLLAPTEAGLQKKRQIFGHCSLSIIILSFVISTCKLFILLRGQHYPLSLYSPLCAAKTALANTGADVFWYLATASPRQKRPTQHNRRRPGEPRDLAGFRFNP